MGNWLQDIGHADPDGVSWVNNTYYSNPQVYYKNGTALIQWAGGAGGTTNVIGPIVQPRAEPNTIGDTIPKTSGKRRVLGKPLVLNVLNGIALIAVSFGQRADVTANTNVTKVWMNGTKVIDPADGLDGSGIGITAWRAYGGTDTQRPDPAIVGIHGPTALAYRDHIYAVFEGVDLNNFGMRPPSIDGWLEDADSDLLSFGDGVEPEFDENYDTNMDLQDFGDYPDSWTTATAGNAAAHLTTILNDKKLVWKFYIKNLTGGMRLGVRAAGGTPGAPPGFSDFGYTIDEGGVIYDGFPRPGVAFTMTEGDYVLLATDGNTGASWIAHTTETGEEVNPAPNLR